MINSSLISQSEQVMLHNVSQHVIQQTFATVDPRFGQQWSIPFEAVYKTLKHLDRQFAAFAAREDVACLSKVCDAGCGDYITVIRKVSAKTKAYNESHGI